MCGETNSSVVSEETPVDDITWTHAFKHKSIASKSPVMRKDSEHSNFSWRLSNVEFMPFGFVQVLEDI